MICNVFNIYLRNSCQDVALGDVRFESVCPPQELSLQEGDDVEVMWKNKGDAPTQWYTAKVRNVKVSQIIIKKYYRNN